MSKPSKGVFETGWRNLLAVAVTILAALGLLVALLWMLMALLFFGNFSLSNYWHLYVLLHTFGAPVGTLVCYTYFFLWPDVRTAALSAAVSLATLATWLVWTSESSRGLIH